MAEEDTLHYFKINTPLSLSVRFYRGDRDGVVLNPSYPHVEVPESKLKDFKRVNKGAILDGKLIEIQEPEETWETDNALSDEDITALLTSVPKLKKGLAKITSVSILYKILAAVDLKGSAPSTRQLVTDRIEEVEPALQGPVDRNEMAGSKDVGSILSSRE